MQDVCGVPMRAVVHRRAFGLRHRRRIQFGALAVGRVDAIQIVHGIAVTLEAVIKAAPVHAPIRILDRLTHPVRVGHDGFQIQRPRTGLRRCHGRHYGEGYEAGEQQSAHGILQSRNGPA